MTEEIQAEVIEEEPVTEAPQEEGFAFDINFPEGVIVRITSELVAAQILEGLQSIGVRSVAEITEIIGANLPLAE